MRTSIFPKSLVAELADLVDHTRRLDGNDGLLFAGPRGGIMRRATFQSIWIRSADAAGWPMKAPLRRTAGYDQTNKGWRWTGAAESTAAVLGRPVKKILRNDGFQHSGGATRRQVLAPLASPVSPRRSAGQVRNGSGTRDAAGQRSPVP